MAQNEEIDGTGNTATQAENGESSAGKLTHEEIQSLTDETAERLLRLGGGEAQEWIEKGRIIDEFVERLQPAGKFSKPNPFGLLAAREDLPWRASQLRTYRDAFLLWNQVGGEKEAPKVDVTTVGLVLTLNHESAKKILKRAAKEKLSTRQVAALVKKEKGKQVAEKTERVAGDWKLLCKAVEHLESELSLMLDVQPNSPPDPETIKKLEVVLSSIQAILAAIGH